MVERGRRRRKPLVLSSTKALVDSLLHSDKAPNDSDGVLGIAPATSSSAPTLQLAAGILRCSEEDKPFDSVDDFVLVGLSTSALKRLSITSGSLILVQNIDASVSRIGQAVVLDPPNSDGNVLQCRSVSSASPKTMLVFPSYTYSKSQSTALDHQVAYLSPILMFNLSLHTSCLKSIVQQGKDTLSSLFGVQENGKTNGEENELSSVTISLQPWAGIPVYASHLRASFVKIPECGTLGRLKTRSFEEAQDRQDLIDLALNDYFSVDRFLSRGDLFSVRINWNCKSELCIPCNQKMQNGGDNTIYFKVVAMEPSEEPVLRINRSQTALVLGGGVPSSVPPKPLIPEPKSPFPLQVDAVLSLASILAPTLCPSALSSRFRVAVLLHGVPGCGKRTVMRYVARHLGLHVVEYSCQNFLTSSEKKISVALTEAFSLARRYCPTILLLRHFEVFRNIAAQEGSSNEQFGINSEVAHVIRQCTEPVTEDADDYDDANSIGDYLNISKVKNSHPVLLVAAADSSEGLPPTIRRCFSHEIKIGPLSEEQRFQLLSQSFQHVSDLIPNNSVEDLVKDMVGQTSGFMPRDLHALVADAGANLISERQGLEAGNMNHGQSESDSTKDNSKVIESLGFGKDNLSKALERSKKRNASALGTPKVPNVKWEDVGGLEDVKKSILDTVQLPLLHKDLFSSGLRKRSGVLLYGPPGTGKTLLAKAVATECSLNFLSVKGPELINMYIGESEKNVRDIFQKARAARPCVIFFDELDSLAPARGASGDSGGVMDRVVSQMLAEIDGLNDSSQDLFIIGASNRPDLIDPALLRPGRFDKLLYVGVNSEASYRERVLKALTRKFKLHGDVSLYDIALKCPPNFTGADMYALCADAWFHAAKRKVLLADSGSGVEDHPDSIVVEYEDFVEVLRELSPSLSMAELKKYEMLRDQFQGSTK
ncbi:peroxisome biogenesis protein 6 [Andrographis paniculata]|uniref:peroxisome biogenesis protein 6 n=1 Tax=Andrographis paniculata TaxID=175694 RepID=UPI0021E875FD|nr:peroxisome biogenesis protein 6 [Andrographis paniculata]XP_051118597.1 peroxisome biogenesis protein 6 [Andrographis paniculata]